VKLNSQKENKKEISVFYQFCKQLLHTTIVACWISSSIFCKTPFYEN